MRRYALAVSFVGVVGVLVGIVPFARSVEAYRHPVWNDPRGELPPFEIYRLQLLQNLAEHPARQLVMGSGLAAAYADEKDQRESEKIDHIVAIHSEAWAGMVGYGSLIGLGALFAVAPLLWLRRQAGEPTK